MSEKHLHRYVNEFSYRHNTSNHKTVPDISVGIAWGKYWESNNFNGKFGQRIKYEHHYPSYYPQAESNPQKPWAYPDISLIDKTKNQRRYTRNIHGHMHSGTMDDDWYVNVCCEHIGLTPISLDEIRK